jgi:hypothetical protein
MAADLLDYASGVIVFAVLWLIDILKRRMPLARNTTSCR